MQALHRVDKTHHLPDGLSFFSYTCRMRIEIERLNQDYHLRATNEEGIIVEADGAASIGGQGKGMRPMQMLIASLGSCSAIDLVLFLRKMRQPLVDLKIRIDAEREKDKNPALFTDVHLHYMVWGDLDPTKVEKAITMSVDQYCSVARIIEKTAKITWSYALNPEG